ncbi:hypothetical protein [Agromyces bauzanensis]
MMISPATDNLQHIDDEKDEHPAWGWRALRILAEYGAPTGAHIPDMTALLEQSFGTTMMTVWQDVNDWYYEITLSNLWVLVTKLQTLARELTATEATS